MLRRGTRRVAGGALVVVGVALMVLAPDSPGGLAALGAALVLELVGLALEKRD